MSKKINMVIVTYKPNIPLLENCILSILDTIDNIYIINNSNNKLNIRIKNDKVNIIYLEKNMGISYAQNIGIKKSLKDGASFILLSDQDTVYPKNYLHNMMHIYRDGYRIAAIAPLLNDVNQLKSNEGFTKKTLLGFKYFYPNNGQHEVFQLIASGQILNTKYLKDIGLMNEELFIDWVDYEWSWRANKKGYKLIGNADVVIQHVLGDKTNNIGFREVGLRTPLRHYYITRNAFYLALKDTNLDFLHRVALFLKSFKYVLGYPILSKPHLKHLKYVLLGFLDGIMGKLGKLDDQN